MGASKNQGQLMWAQNSRLHHIVTPKQDPTYGGRMERGREKEKERRKRKTMRKGTLT